MPLLVRIALLCLCLIHCFGFKLNTFKQPDHDYLSRLLDQYDVLKIKDIDNDDKKKYITDYVSHLFEEISILDGDISMIASDDNWSEMEKNMAHVQILQGNVDDDDVLHFDISRLPRNIQISHVEVVVSADHPTNQNSSSDEKYTVFDVTVDFQKAYNSDASEFVSKIYFADSSNTQVVIFENINNTVLSSLRLRRKRDIRDIRSIKQEVNEFPDWLMCLLKPWTVDLSVLWGNRLVYPNEYNLNLCYGSCATDLRNNYTWHAKIKRKAIKLAEAGKDFNGKQQIAHIDVHCTPSAYSPLSIVRLDENGSLRIDQLPYMQVVACMCH